MLTILKMTGQGAVEVGRVNNGQFSGDVPLLSRLSAALGPGATEDDWLRKYHGSYLWAEETPLSQTVKAALRQSETSEN
jgi:hypothetical protein